MSRLRPLALRVLAILALPLALPAQGTPDPLAQKVRAWRIAHAQPILEEFAALLALPNQASDSLNIRRNAQAIRALYEKRGGKTRLLEAPGSPPAVLGERVTPGATRTILIYVHYDGQPVRANEWTMKAYEPTVLAGRLEDKAEKKTLAEAARPENELWRLYARSASDDKAPVIALASALDALAATNTKIPANLKFFFEGEEEAGSTHLADMLARHKDALKADVVLFFDGPRHQSGVRQVVYGVRGVMGVEIAAYGPVRPLHSGHYGNWAPNPGVRLAHFIGSLRDDDGKILIPDFYADVRPLAPAERASLATIPNADAKLREELLLGGSEGGNASLSERIMLPALNLRGIVTGGVGAGATNAVPTIARASIDFRLVPNQDPARIRRLLEAHAVAQGWTVVHDSAAATPALRRAKDKVMLMDWGENGYASQRTSLDHPLGRDVVRIVERASGERVAVVPTLGGSAPLIVFEQVLGIPIINVPIANYDNSQHAPNENIRLKEFWEGIEMYAGLMAKLGAPVP
ncbi:MAG: M20/M25/M40 family metallo-hydrolase [Gemmatimonadetes bacterium]|nr:M20/M25/M40 family metallo-hydrolase [Gemmatimonadota bacterium]